MSLTRIDRTEAELREAFRARYQLECPEGLYDAIEVQAAEEFANMAIHALIANGVSFRRDILPGRIGR